MIKFITKLFVLSLTIVAIIVGMHIVAIYNLQDDVDKAYTLEPNQKYLFLGSSQFGCAVEERKDLNNRVLWVSDTTILHSLIRLKELEDRGQLKNIKVVFIPWNFVVPNQYSEKTIKWGCYQELPVTIKHIEYYPFHILGLIPYIASNLRFPFCMFAQCNYPTGRPAIGERPIVWQNKFYTKTCRESAGMIYGKGNFDGWEDVLKSNILEMKEICNRNNIVLSAIKMPVLSRYRNNVAESSLIAEKEWLSWFESIGIVVLRPQNLVGNEEDYYFDNVHFMEKGTSEFTQNLFKLIYHRWCSLLN